MSMKAYIRGNKINFIVKLININWVMEEYKWKNRSLSLRGL